MTRNLIAAGGLVGSRNDDWATPQKVFDKINALWDLELDAAASPGNAKLPLYWTKDDDALKQDWTQYRIWCNPPYSLKDAFLEKALDASIKGEKRSVLILPAVPETNWFQHYAKKAEVWFLKGRIQFIPPNDVNKSSNTKGSALFIFDKYRGRYSYFKDLDNICEWIYTNKDLKGNPCRMANGEPSHESRCHQSKPCPYHFDEDEEDEIDETEEKPDTDCGDCGDCLVCTRMTQEDFR